VFGCKSAAVAALGAMNNDDWSVVTNDNASSGIKVNMPAVMGETAYHGQRAALAASTKPVSCSARC